MQVAIFRKDRFGAVVQILCRRAGSDRRDSGAVPRTAGFAATLLGMTMVGAVDIHLLITGGSPVPAVVLLVIAVAVIWYRELYLYRALLKER